MQISFHSNMLPSLPSSSSSGLVVLMSRSTSSTQKFKNGDHAIVTVKNNRGVKCLLILIHMFVNFSIKQGFKGNSLKHGKKSTSLFTVTFYVK